MKILVTVDKFGPLPRQRLKTYEMEGHTVRYNESGEKLSDKALRELLLDENPEIIIAGTEKYGPQTLNYCPNLKMISRVGIGLDSVDLEECKKREITVENTPDAPSNAVAELTIGQMFNSLRRIQETDAKMRDGYWERYTGRDLSECSVGIVGYGRIGKLVAGKLKGLAKNVRVNDIDESAFIGPQNYAEALFYGMSNFFFGKDEVSSLEEIFSLSDIVSLHIPLNDNNRNFIAKKELNKLKKGAILINTSRGGIVNEDDLYDWLKENKDSSAAIDVFEQEPYQGRLRGLENCYLTPHLGSCTEKSRYEMEMGAVENVEIFLTGEVQNGFTK